MGGFFSVIGYAIYNFRRRDPSTKPSVYVIQTRVAAQGLVIGVLTLTAGYHMYQNFVHRKEPHENALNLSEYKHLHEEKPKH